MMGSANDTVVACFTGLIDLAAARLGGKALGASDDFFAGVDNLLKPGRGEFVPGRFTERGKWMDGWESRRRREPGHDWAVVELGAAGRVRGFDIDTNHFLGNHPPYASVDGLEAARGTPLEELNRMRWTSLLGQAPLRPGSQNLFAASDCPKVSHLRLNVFPDGGVARFRAYGDVHGAWEPPELDGVARAHVAPELVDLALLTNGGLALACSDSFFGPMNNLLLPGRAENMGDGWETRRSRRPLGAQSPCHDWILVRLGARGVPEVIEVDTAHFKGNYPDRCSVDVIDSPGASITELLQSPGWTPLFPPTKLQAHARRFLHDELVQHLPCSHVRLNIFPDGGISRLRVWGIRHG
jgi:allantoicase